MNAIPVSIAAAAIVVSGLSAVVLLRRAADADEALAGLQSRLDEVRAAGSAREPSAELERISARLTRLEERLVGLETAPRREAIATDEAPARAEPRVDVVAQPDPPLSRGNAAERAELEQLLDLFGSGYDWEGSSDQLQRFYELAKKTGLIDEKLARLESAVRAAPADLDQRMELADTYVAKLMTIQGPEQGLWGSKAEDQWREVAKRDPEHWRATFSIGQNYAYYPDVMGKTDEAIAHLEHARAIQERGVQGEQHVRTYLSLARLYQRKGDLPRAREVLMAGLRFHSGNTRLTTALDGLNG